MTLNFEISLQLFNQFDAEGEGYADVETFLEVILYTAHVGRLSERTNLWFQKHFLYLNVLRRCLHGRRVT